MLANLLSPDLFSLSYSMFPDAVLFMVIVVELIFSFHTCYHDTGSFEVTMFCYLMRLSTLRYNHCTNGKVQRSISCKVN